MPEFQLENMGLTEADPSTAEYQTLAEAPIVNGEPSDPPVTGISPIKVFFPRLSYTKIAFSKFSNNRSTNSEM